ncbi:MAG: lamin tail domain-containing protein [Rhodoglobus sp.]
MLRTSLAVMLASVIVVGGAVAPAAAGTRELPSVLINELANGGPGSDFESFFELRNWSADAVDLTGWRVFRCSEQGLRANSGHQEVALTGIVLEPGEILTVSMVGMPGDLHIDQVFGASGFGLYLESPERGQRDVVGVYADEPWPTQGECTLEGNLPNSLNFAIGESWQRVAATGDLGRDFVLAPSTIGAQNRSAPMPREDTGVLISEVASAGPAGSADEFVELVNAGASPQDIGGWRLYRCTAEGRLTERTLELAIPAGTSLAPGQRWVVGGDDLSGTADARFEHGLADVTFGVLLQSDDRRLVDRVAVSSHRDTACQDGDSKLPAVLDGVTGESYQRSGDGFIVARRTPGTANATVERSLFAQRFGYPAQPAVAVSELATDPSPEGMPAGIEQRNYIELGNYSRTSVDIGGWVVRRCDVDGNRAAEPQFVVPAGTRLAPGEVYLAAREGTAAAAVADAVYPVSLNFRGTGVWIEDAAGHRIDSVGIYAENEMDSSNVTPSPCAKGAALTTYQPDRLLAETYQRTRFTGVDRDDFMVWEATPGVIDLRDWVDPTARVVTATTAALATPVRVRENGHAMLSEPASVLAAWSGVSTGGPLVTLRGAAESELDPLAPAPVSDDAYGYPYQRFVVDATDLTAGATVGWAGSGARCGAVQFSVWDGAGWRLLDSGADALSGVLVEGDIVDGEVNLLVQDGPRPQPTVTTERDGRLEEPGDYDFSVAHITDTQYLSESYPEVYAQLVSWIADNAEPRKIAFAAHTGDLIQNWVDPDQNEDRARVEFERASAIQSILDDAGVPNSVLPGNHDNKRGVTNDLFNEYFPPERYQRQDWYGGSIAPGDNSASFSTFEHAGARFLMLSLPYAYGEREIVWAQQIVTSHPGHNVILSTHEHVMPATEEVETQRSTRSRWVSQAGALWDRVIAPNRNVVLVLSGHFHGIGRLVTENAGGLPGHTVVELLADYQEFRTHTGERATGFYRMLQFDLDGGAIAVDTRSVRLAVSYSNDYDYPQFVPDDGDPLTPSNARPWRIVDAGLQGRYSAADDEFTAFVEFQHPKLVATDALLVSAP